MLCVQCLALGRRTSCRSRLVSISLFLSLQLLHSRKLRFVDGLLRPDSGASNRPTPSQALCYPLEELAKGMTRTCVLVLSCAYTRERQNTNEASKDTSVRCYICMIVLWIFSTTTRMLETMRARGWNVYVYTCAVTMGDLPAKENWPRLCCFWTFWKGCFLSDYRVEIYANWRPRVGAHGHMGEHTAEIRIRRRSFYLERPSFFPFFTNRLFSLESRRDFDLWLFFLYFVENHVNGLYESEFQGRRFI